MFDKILICDPVCIQPFGHNLNAQNYYRTYFGQFAREPISVGSRHLDDHVAQANDIRQHFSHVYNRDIPAFDPADDPLSHSVDVVHDATEMLRKDFVSLLESHNIGGNDALFFPSIDFWSVLALSACRDIIKARGNPTLLMRFIGVMENACHGSFSEPLDVVGRELRTMMDVGLDIRLSAETGAYADHLAMMTRRPVTVTPYPEVGAMMPPPAATSQFVVACPGSARGDKGYFDLLEIFTSVRLQDPEQTIGFVLQRLPDRDNIHHLSYLAKLYSIPGVTILPASLSKDEIDAIYRNAHLILVPYQPHIYQLRGSAVTMEAISYGRQLVTFDGTAFAEQIRFYGAGAVCQDTASIASTILHYARLPQDDLNIRSLQARHRFLTDVKAAYNDWLAA